MKGSKGLSVVFEHFDFDATCEIVSFETTYLPLKADPVSRVNTGRKWAENTLRIIEQARPGNAYFFDNIMIKCPGDAVPRNLGVLSFKLIG